MLNTFVGLVPVQVSCHLIQDQTCHNLSYHRKGCLGQGKFTLMFFFWFTAFPNSQSSPRIRTLDMKLSLQNGSDCTELTSILAEAIFHLYSLPL